MFGKAHGYLCSTPSLRSFFSIAFEFNTFSMLVWLMVALLQPSKAYHWELPPFYAPLRWFTVWCPRLDVPAASVASSSTLGTNSGCFAQQSICSPCTGMSRTVYLCTGVFKDGCWTLSMTHIINASVGSSHPTFCSDMRMAACLAWLVVQQRAWVTASTSTVKWRLHCLQMRMMVTSWLTLEPHHYGCLVTEPLVYIMRVWGFLIIFFWDFFLNEKIDF